MSSRTKVLTILARLIDRMGVTYYLHFLCLYWNSLRSDYICCIIFCLYTFYAYILDLLSFTIFSMCGSILLTTSIVLTRGPSILTTLSTVSYDELVG